MDQFIAKANVDRLKERLTEDLSQAERQTVERLLAEEESKLVLALARPKSKQEDR